MRRNRFSAYLKILPQIRDATICGRGFLPRVRAETLLRKVRGCLLVLWLCTVLPQLGPFTKADVNRFSI